jgi:hypothetical protein
VFSEPVAMHGLTQSISLSLPPLGILILKRGIPPQMAGKSDILSQGDELPTATDSGTRSQGSGISKASTKPKL